MEKYGIFFDLDGTLVDNEHLKAVAFSDAIKSFGGNSNPSIYKEVMGMDGLSIRKHFAAKAGIPIDLDDYFEAFKSIYENLLHNNISVKPGVISFLAKLKSNGIKMALISSAYSASVNFIVNRLNLGPFFNYIVTGDDVQKKKPNPDCYFLALKKMNLPKNQAVVFEDTESGLWAAFYAGIKSIGIRHDYNQSHDFSNAISVYTSYENDINKISNDINSIFNQNIL